MRTIVAIGGSDSAGCSGIQADLKAVSAFDLHCSTVITAITAQNTLDVKQNQSMTADIVKNQLQAVLSDLSVGAIKMGLLGTAETIRTIAQVLREKTQGQMPIIVDPVIRSSTGEVLLTEDAQAELLKQIIPLTTLLTPNTNEARILTGIPVQTIDDAINAGRSLIALGCEGVLIKGGHLKSDPGTDILVLPSQIVTFPGKPIASSNTRGTGCSLASAIAACMLKGMSLVASIQTAKEFVRRSIASSYSIGRGPGPIDSFHCQRYPQLHRMPMGRFHAITDQTLQTTYSHIELASFALRGGADVIQYRDKSNLDSMARIRIAKQIGALCKENGASLIVNDRTEVARGAVASGVHIGKDDLPPSLARQIMGPMAFIGKTANSLEEALQADQEPVDYIGVGPIFGTTSKINALDPLGLEALERIANQTDKPIIAIGGIEPDRVDSVIGAGAFGIAILSGLWKGPDPMKKIQSYTENIRAAVFKRREIE
jgi:hydroxymethylpyrimidine kinase/phosphomethylpyrimidine kinase/thiamine-phosphate diphosphorylase